MSHPGSFILTPMMSAGAASFGPALKASPIPLGSASRMSSAIQIQNVGKSFPVKTSRKGAENGFVALENISLEMKIGRASCRERV